MADLCMIKISLTYRFFHLTIKTDKSEGGEYDQVYNLPLFQRQGPKGFWKIRASKGKSVNNDCKAPKF